MFQNLTTRFVEWMAVERPNTDFPLCDFERIRYELRPCDVLLIEGRSRVSEVIKQITQSSWSHACLYIGKIHDIDDFELRKMITEHFNGDPDIQLVIEGYIGKGTIVSPLENYRSDHIRICRPRSLSRPDAQQVIAYAINRLGTEYDLRQLFDLARFLIPWSVLPRKWRSSLFEHHVGEPTKTVCSTMIAEAFASIDFPILPVVKQHEETGIELFMRNPRLFTPRDFDYSPYFEIIKYPFIAFAESPYRHLPWNKQRLVSHDGENIPDPKQDALKPKSKKFFKLKNKVRILNTTDNLPLNEPENSDSDDVSHDAQTKHEPPAANIYTTISDHVAHLFNKKANDMLER
ncbi:MAG: hypothetical protein JSS07_00245 [Proteobacteria bacterium]|nr:hypothetical protein [Pseudomonadota bacterium]